jgi:hypothetical protein
MECNFIIMNSMSLLNNFLRIIPCLLLLGVLTGAEPAKGYVQVTATGSAETRDSALIDACRLAVAKVHGTRIIGVMSNRNSEGFKIDANGKSGGKDGSLSIFGRTTSVGDNTSMTFGGLLLRYEVVKEEKEAGSTGRWKVQIKGDVLNALPDKFAGRQAVVLPRIERIAKSLAAPNASPELVKDVALALQMAVRNTFANHPQFVILERENEDVLNEELERASGANAAVMEQSKLKGEKVADIVVEVQSQPIKVSVNTTTFENTPSLQKVQIQISGLIRLLDVASKGEICSVSFEAKNPKPISSAGDIQPAVAKAFDDLKANLDNSLRTAKCNLLGRLGLANLVFTKAGSFALSGGIDPNLLVNGDKISLWKGEGVISSKVTEGVINLNGASLNVENLSVAFAEGDAITFRIESTPVAVLPKNENEQPKTPSLKDKIKFD